MGDNPRQVTTHASMTWRKPMSRRVLGTLQLLTAVGAAVTAAACSGPLPSDGTAVETRASALSGPPGMDAGPGPGGGGGPGSGAGPGPGPGPGPAPVFFFVNSPTSMYVGVTSPISVQMYASTFTTSDVTLTINLTGSFTLGFANTFMLSPGGCTQDTSVPGAATVT